MMNKRKIFMLVSIITLVVVIIGGVGTYAWYVWNAADDDKTQIVTNVGAATVYYDGGSAITDAKLRPVSGKEKGIVKTIQIKSNISAGLSFNLYLDVVSLDENLKDESFRYAIYEDDSENPITWGNFGVVDLNSSLKDCNANTGVKHIVLLSNHKITTTLTNYTLYIWIDGANYVNPSEMADKSFSFDLHASGEDAVIMEGKIPDITQTINGTLAYNLVSLYNGAGKTETTNNAVKYYLDTENDLMSDIAGNVRFYGENPNNYMYFNCDDYSDQSSDSCELWRIIGVFGDKVKIIKNDSIGDLSWDLDKNQDSTSVTSSNDWENSSLQEFLNGLYYDRGETTTYTYISGNGGSELVNLDLTTIGITNATRNANLISNSTWFLGGYSSSSGMYPNDMYINERTATKGTTIYGNNPSIINRNIGLMYASDYGYATDLSKCSLDLGSYGSDTNSGSCKKNNWLFNKLNQWFLTPQSNHRQGIFVAGQYGSVYHGYSAFSSQGVRPSLYLEPSIKVEIDGDGTLGNPYKIIVE